MDRLYIRNAHVLLYEARKNRYGLVETENYFILLYFACSSIFVIFSKRCYLSTGKDGEKIVISSKLYPDRKGNRIRNQNSALEVAEILADGWRNKAKINLRPKVCLSQMKIKTISLTSLHQSFNTSIQRPSKDIQIIENVSEPMVGWSGDALDNFQLLTEWNRLRKD